MGLFSRKKPEEKQELPPLKFPEFQKEQVYERKITPSDQGVIKKTIAPPPNLMIPIRKPVMLKSEETHFEEKPRVWMEERPRPRIEPRAEEYKPMQRERTIYVKVDKYKEVMAKMTEIRAKVGDVERVMKRLHEIRSQEEQELRNWENDLNKVKDTLIAIDKTLFD